MNSTEELTFGGKRIRVSFNPSKDSSVDRIKGKTAELIDLVQEMPKPDTDDKGRGEFARLCSLANTAYEEAAMWAVKAATFDK